MHFLVTCKYKNDLIKNNREKGPDQKQSRKGGDIGQLASEILKFESVDDDGRRWQQWMADGPLVYYKLTLWAFGSGELINL